LYLFIASEHAMIKFEKHWNLDYGKAIRTPSYPPGPR